jgi:alpha-galactosidase
MDASWNLPTRDANGNLQPNPALWPNGLQAVVDYVHSKGLGFGLYGDRGSMDCAKNPGNLGHETQVDFGLTREAHVHVHPLLPLPITPALPHPQDAAFYAAMEIDWYKSDSCYAAADPATAFAEYGKMRDALNATGRHIWFALCGWNTWYAPQGKSLGNSWRIGVDTGGGWQNVLENVEAILGLAQYAGPSSGGGGWNDMSLLLTPGA